MTVQNLFEMMEKANEFKKMIGEFQFGMTVIVDGNAIGMAHSYKWFEKLLNETFHDDAVKSILTSEVKKNICNRMFKIVYTFDGKQRAIELLAE